MSSNKLTGKFIRIPFDFFNNDTYNLFTQVSTKGFYLYSYLLYRQNSSSSCETTLKMIQSFLNRDFDTRPTIYYGKKKHKVELIKEKETIIKFLSILHKSGLIKVGNVDFTEDNKAVININKTLIIQVKQFTESNFIAIPEQLYFDKIHKIGHIG
jgi:hypothetical protein